jgi:hypothetical protein
LGISEGILQRDKFNSEPLDGRGDTKERRRATKFVNMCEGDKRGVEDWNVSRNLALSLFQFGFHMFLVGFINNIPQRIWDKKLMVERIHTMEGRVIS